MLPNLAQHLVDPITSKPLTLARPPEGRVERHGRIESGTLVAADGAKWPIVRGVPRFVPKALLDEETKDDDTADVTSTSRTFGRKWREARSLEYGSNASDRASMIEVMRHMLRADDEAAVMKKLGDAEAVLNVGCGVAWPEAMFNPSTKTLRCAIDYSLSVETALVRTRDYDNVLVAQADLFRIPFPTSRFDIIFSGRETLSAVEERRGCPLILSRHPAGLL